MGKLLIISSANFSTNCVENTNKYKMLKTLPLVDKLDINKYLKQMIRSNNLVVIQ